MNRLKVFLLVIFSGVVLAHTACAQNGDEYVEGQHYRVLDSQIPLHNPDKIEVAEFFAYTCSHCFSFESTSRSWKSQLTEDVNFVYIPAVWNGQMEVMARAFYTAQILGELDKVHQAMFNTIHIDRELPRNQEEVTELFAAHGVDKEAVEKTFGSFGVTSLLKQADSRARGAKLSGTPTLMINGTYVIEVKQGEINHGDMLKIADFLIAKIRDEAM